MRQYLDLLRDIVNNGEFGEDRTGTGTQSVFGRQLRFNMEEGFPLLTTKKLHVKSILHELLWMISGSTNVKPLQEAGVRIWDEWADENGELGPVYGAQWRSWPKMANNYQTAGIRGAGNTIDQLLGVQKSIRENPKSRRHIVTAWNPAEVDDMALPPCHMMFQFYVRNGRLSLHMYQRSADVFLGVPFNIASYAFLLHAMSFVTGLRPADLIISFGDVHIYNNHRDQVLEQIKRVPSMLPELAIVSAADCITKLKFEDFRVYNYNTLPSIKGEVSV